MFLWNFEKALLEILRIRLVHFASPEKFICVLIRVFSWKIHMFSFLHSSLLENLMCSRNLFKNVIPGKKEQIFLAK